MWMNLLYGFQKRQAAVSVFATPYTLKATVFLYFSVIEQTFYKIILDSQSRTYSNKCLNYNFIVFLKFIIDNHIVM
nr:MAG TPA: hypothetical protein [Caudoviricetes sp.]